MKPFLGKPFIFSRLFTVIGGITLVSMLLFQSFGTESIANASNRDEFPGRRQGGGTHWVMPKPSDVE
jgi:hypothetical protein